jgi:hypothetical protein
MYDYDTLANPHGLTDAQYAHVQKLSERGDILVGMLQMWTRGNKFGIKDNIPPAHIDKYIAELKATTDEMQSYLPPEEQEAIREEMFQRKMVQEGVAMFERNQKLYDHLISDVRVDTRYRRVAEHAAKWAVRQLKYVGPLPKIQYFFGSRTEPHSGFYRPSEPDRIHIADNLDDRALTSCVIHECGHFVNGPHTKNDEDYVREMEERLAPEYWDEYGRTEYGEWRSCA